MPVRIYSIVIAAVALMAVGCGSSGDARPRTPVATTDAPAAPSLNNPTAELSPTAGPAAEEVPSPTAPEPSVPPPTPTPAPPAVEPTAVSPSTPTSEPTGVPPELRYLALGDSYTIGEGVASSLRWPVQLAERLRSAGLPVGAPQIVARTGWTTSDLDAGIDRASPQGTFDIVTLLIGVNDQFQGRPVESFRQGFRDLLRRAIVFAGDSPSKVLVVSIPDWGVTPFASGLDRGRIADEIDLFNQTAREETDQAGALFVDITGISQEAGTDLRLVASDGLHPSGLMYERWAELLLLEVIAVLE